MGTLTEKKKIEWSDEIVEEYAMRMSWRMAPQADKDNIINVARVALEVSTDFHALRALEDDS